MSSPSTSTVAPAGRKGKRLQQPGQKLARHVAANAHLRDRARHPRPRPAEAESPSLARSGCPRRADARRRPGRRSAARACAQRHRAGSRPDENASAAVSVRIDSPDSPSEQICRLDRERTARAGDHVARRASRARVACATRCPARFKASSMTLVSSDSSRPSSSVVPAASAASSSMRLDRLLDPGMRTVPETFAIGGRSRNSIVGLIATGPCFRCVPRATRCARLRASANTRASAAPSASASMRSIRSSADRYDASSVRSATRLAMLMSRHISG